MILCVVVYVTDIYQKSYLQIFIYIICITDIPDIDVRKTWNAEKKIEGLNLRQMKGQKQHTTQNSPVNFLQNLNRQKRYSKCLVSLEPNEETKSLL